MLHTCDRCNNINNNAVKTLVLSFMYIINSEALVFHRFPLYTLAYSNIPGKLHPLKDYFVYNQVIMIIIITVDF